MTRRARILAVLLIAVLLASCSNGRGRITGADAPSAAVPDLAGNYVLNGVDPEGDEYGGVLTIMPGQAPGQYKLQWIVTGNIQEGEGAVEGNRLKVEWRSSAADPTKGTRGHGAYTITTERELYGTRSVDGAEGEAEEKAFPNLRR